MSEHKTFYITTPIYYPNDSFLYTSAAADAYRAVDPGGRSITKKKNKRNAVVLIDSRHVTHYP